jgi:hypothetical protein
MATTIQISEEVQQKLFQFMNQKEKELGYRISYNDAIEMLLETQGQRMDKKSFINHIEKFMGILDITDVIQARNEERQLEHVRDQRFDRY